MSDISLHFPWWANLLFFLFTGWPGCLIGGFLGALAWRGHRVRGGFLGALVGDLIWAAFWWLAPWG